MSRKYTPEIITQLEPDDVFVFGNNRKKNRND